MSALERVASGEGALRKKLGRRGYHGDSERSEKKGRGDMKKTEIAVHAEDLFPPPIMALRGKERLRKR